MKNDRFEQELQVELSAVENDLKWWDLQLKNEHYLAPHQKLELLKKKYAIIKTMRFGKA